MSTSTGTCVASQSYSSPGVNWSATSVFRCRRRGRSRSWNTGCRLACECRRSSPGSDCRFPRTSGSFRDRSCRRSRLDCRRVSRSHRPRFSLRAVSAEFGAVSNRQSSLPVLMSYAATQQLAPALVGGRPQDHHVPDDERRHVVLVTLLVSARTLSQITRPLLASIASRWQSTVAQNSVSPAIARPLLTSYAL